jgi:hypothetical protein
MQKIHELTKDSQTLRKLTIVGRRTETREKVHGGEVMKKKRIKMGARGTCLQS